MASAFYWADAQAKAMGDAVNVATTGLGGATAVLYEGTKPANANAALGTQTTIATFALPAYSSNTVSSAGLITLGAISSVIAANSSTPSSTTLWIRVTASNGTTRILDCNAGLTGATPDAVLDTTTIIAGDTVAITAWTIQITE